jgi:hypothetical protein
LETVLRIAATAPLDLLARRGIELPGLPSRR